MSPPREHLPVYGRRNITSTINSLSGLFRCLQHLYGKSTTLWDWRLLYNQTKISESASASAICASRNLYLTTTRWLCAIFETTCFPSIPSSDSGGPNRAGWSFFATANARLWLAQRACSRSSNKSQIISKGQSLQSSKCSCTRPEGNIFYDFRRLSAKQ